MSDTPDPPPPDAGTPPGDRSGQPRCLVTGASGFVGGKLLRRLLDQPVRLRATVRNADAFDPPQADRVEVVEADLQDPASIGPAVAGVDVAYYLVHSMGGDGDLAARDRSAAMHFATAAQAAGVRRIVYMGAVGYDPDGGSSAHLESRHEVEEILALAAPEFVAVRASMAVGAGSGSFRTLLQIVERLPVLALPAWRDSRSQPIAIADLVDCLVAARDVAPGRYEIAGPEVLTIEQMTRILAELLDKPYRAVPVPVNVPRLEGAVASVIADEDRHLITSLLEGLQDDLVVEDNALTSVFGVTPTPFRTAARDAIAEDTD